MHPLKQRQHSDYPLPPSQFVINWAEPKIFTTYCWGVGKEGLSLDRAQSEACCYLGKVAARVGDLVHTALQPHSTWLGRSRP